MLSKYLNRLWCPDIAIDLGTATTRVAVARGNYTFAAPSSWEAVPALAKGVVVNVDAAAEALRPAFDRLKWYGVAAHPRVLACAPTDTSLQEREAVVEACYRAGAAAVALMPEPVAAALGDGVDYHSLFPTLLMDIGEGVTDCAVIRQGRLTASFACRIACADLRVAVADAVWNWSGVAVSAAEAQRLLSEVGVERAPLDPDGLPQLRSLRVSGTARSTARAGGGDVPVGVLQEALEPVTRRIIGTVASLIDAAPALRDDLRVSGIRLSGGGALLPGFSRRISETIGLPVHVVRHPLDSVVQGAKRVLPIAAAHDLWHQVGER